MDMTDQFHLLQKKDLASFGTKTSRSCLTTTPSNSRPRNCSNLLVFLKTLKVRDLEKVAAQSSRGEGLAYNRLHHSQKEPQNWLTYWGEYQGRHYSA